MTGKARPPRHDRRGRGTSALQRSPPESLRIKRMRARFGQFFRGGSGVGRLRNGHVRSTPADHRVVMRSGRRLQHGLPRMGSRFAARPAQRLAMTRRGRRGWRRGCGCWVRFGEAPRVSAGCSSGVQGFMRQEHRLVGLFAGNNSRKRWTRRMPPGTARCLVRSCAVEHAQDDAVAPPRSPRGRTPQGSPQSGPCRCRSRDNRNSRR